VAIILLAAGLRAWGLDGRGYGNPYYAAAVRSMLESWHNFFFNAFDPAGFVSVDKPPVALWVQVASAKVLGFSGLAVLLPQVLEGLAAIALVYHLVRRAFGTGAGLLAALFLAVTPVSVAMDRGGGTDSCLILVLLLAAWALTHAVESGSRRFWLLSMGLVGVGFNVKMMEALGVVPVFMASYYAGAPIGRRRKLGALAMGAVALAVVSLSWPLVYDLTPADSRPFVGSSTHNSMLELAAAYNGIDRFIPRGRAPVSAGQNIGSPVGFARGRMASRAGVVPDPRAPHPAETGPAAVGAVPQGGRVPWNVRRGGMGTIPIGPLRLADPRLADQASWLLPLAIVGAVAPLWGAGRSWPLSPAQLALGLWTGWALTYAIVYSYAGGMFRPYYLLTLAPPLAALAGIGGARLWAWVRQGGPGALWLPGVLVATAVWQACILRGALGGMPGRLTGFPAGVLGGAPARLGEWRGWLDGVILGVTVLGLSGLLAVFLRRSHGDRVGSMTTILLALGMAGLLVIPTAWAWSSGLRPPMFAAILPASHPGSARSREAGPRGRLGGVDPKLLAFLEGNHGSERYLLATATALPAAPLIIETGEPVMAMGGFTGRDPILTPQKLAGLVHQGQVRFVLLGSLGGAGWTRGGAPAQAALIDWVRAHGRPVDPSLWRFPVTPAVGRTAAPAFGRGLADAELYDLGPTQDQRQPVGQSP